MHGMHAVDIQPTHHKGGKSIMPCKTCGHGADEHCKFDPYVCVHMKKGKYCPCDDYVEADE